MTQDRHSLLQDVGFPRKQPFKDFDITCVPQQDGTILYACPVPECEKSYASNAGCKQHYMNSHCFSKNRYVCQFCRKVFSNRGALRNHKISIHNANSHLRCRFCNRTYLDKPRLQSHMERCPNRQYIL